MTADAARSFVARAPGSSPPAGRRARCAARRSTRRATSARGATATTSTRPGVVRCSTAATTLDALREGEIEIVGRIVGSSNNAMLVTRDADLRGPGADRSSSTRSTSRRSASGRSTTSPTARWPAARWPPGTSPRRRGWGIVPPTILRDGPFGEGMVQAFVEADPEVDVVAMVVEDDPRLRRMAVLDAVDEQHRPQGRPHPAGRRRAARLRRRPRGVLLARPQAPDGAVGLARRAAGAGRDRGPRARSARRSTASSA